jgi:hypothetical protein
MLQYSHISFTLAVLMVVMMQAIQSFDAEGWRLPFHQVQEACNSNVGPCELHTVLANNRLRDWFCGSQLFAVNFIGT